MPYISNESLPYLVDKLIDANNIKISGNPHGTRVKQVVDKLVEKSDNATGAVDITLENSSLMFKVGDSDNGQSTVAGIEDGFTEVSMKGQTYQNLILENNIETVPSGSLTSSDLVEHTLSGTKPGNVDVKISGRTLQDMCGTETKRASGVGDGLTVSDNGDYFLITKSDTSPHYAKANIALYRPYNLFKPSTVYTLIINRVDKPTNKFCVYDSASASTILNYSSSTIIKFTTPSAPSQLLLYCMDEKEKVVKFYKNFMILEGDYTTENLSYVKGMESAGELEKFIEVKSCGKNLCDKKLCNYANLGNEGQPLVGDNVRSFIIPCKPNTTYSISRISGKNNRFGIYSGRKIGNSLPVDAVGNYSAVEYDTKVSETYTTKGGHNVLWVYLSNSLSDPFTGVEVQIEESTSITSYEAYQEDVEKFSIAEPLRRLPNGVCDTIEKINGRYVLTRKIGSLTLDSSNINKAIMNVGTGSVEGMTPFAIAAPVRNFKKGPAMFPVVSNNFSTNTGTSYRAYKSQSICHYHDSSADLAGSIPTKMLSEVSSNGIKNWFLANPTTIYYELAEPLIEEIGRELSFNTYLNATHLVSSNAVQPLLKVNSSGRDYRAIIKPNTDYTIKWSAVGGDANLNLNLGGATKTVDRALNSTIIKTPSALANTNLSISGWGIQIKDVMVLEGNKANAPFVEGVVGVGKLSKNLFRGGFKIGNIDGAGNEIPSQNYMYSEEYFKVEKNVKYAFSYKIENQYGNNGFIVHRYDIDKRHIADVGWNSFFMSSQDGYIRLKTRKADSSVLSNADAQQVSKTTQMEVGDRVTSYEAGYSNHKIEIKSCGKNLFNPNDIKREPSSSCRVFEKLEMGYYTECLSPSTLFETNLRLKPNTEYRISYEVEKSGGNSVNAGNLDIYDKDNRKVRTMGAPSPSQKVAATFRTNNNLEYFFRFQPYGIGNDVGRVFVKWSNILLEESTSYTNCEVYKEDRIHYIIEEPLHRLPNGVCDEIIDGKLIKRVERVVFDGSENWEQQEIPNSKSLGFYISAADLKKAPSKTDQRNVISSNFPAGTAGTSNNSLPRAVSWNGSFTNLLVDIEKEALISKDLAGFKKWLSNNPTVFYYELISPVVTNLDMQSIRLFANGYIHFGTSVAPTIRYKALLNKSAQIESSVKEVQSLDARVDNLESFYDDMILETSHRLNLLDLDFDYIRESEEV